MNSPDIDSDKAVFRKHEMTFSGHHDYPYHWIVGEGRHDAAHSGPA